ncbi:MAG: hypothetical protein Q9165_005024 [Trypethelium subeluteriae]
METFQLNFWTNDNSTKHECQSIIDEILESPKFGGLPYTTRVRIESFLPKFLKIQVDSHHALSVFKALQSTLDDNNIDFVSFFQGLETVVALAMVSFQNSAEPSTGYTQSEISDGVFPEDVERKLQKTTQQYVTVHRFLKERLNIKAMPPEDDSWDSSVVEQKRPEKMQIKSCRRRDTPEGKENWPSDYCAFTRLPDGREMHPIPHDVAAAKEWTLWFWLFLALVLGENIFKQTWELCGGQRCRNGRNLCIAVGGLCDAIDNLELGLQPCHDTTIDGKACEAKDFRKLSFHLRYYTHEVQSLTAYLADYHFQPKQSVAPDITVEYWGRWEYKDGGVSVPFPHPLLFGIRDFMCRCYAIFSAEAGSRKNDNRFVDWRTSDLHNWSQAQGDSRGTRSTRLSVSQTSVEDEDQPEPYQSYQSRCGVAMKPHIESTDLDS